MSLCRMTRSWEKSSGTSLEVLVTLHWTSLRSPGLRKCWEEGVRKARQLEVKCSRLEGAEHRPSTDFRLSVP